jgi:nucleoside-diphosphate-sugar epimerase
LAGASGSEVDYVYGPAMHGEQQRSVIDPGKAARVINWRPTVSIEQGLAKTYVSFSQ